MKISLLLLIHFSLLGSMHGFHRHIFDPLNSVLDSIVDHVSNRGLTEEYSYSPIYVGQQDGLKDGDKISALPGQPAGTDFNQYSGYVTIEPKNGKALFYYLTESPSNSSSNPLVLWLNGGPGCSSFGAGAMMELGPFRVNSDNKTLSRNKYAWNNVANVLFLDSPAGVGFSYSNTTSDYEIGDSQTAKDSYTFLVNWLERFKEYKKRDFYIAGESYAGHYVPQLAQLILQNNKLTNQTVINLKGIALGNAYMDKGTANKGLYEYLWTHAIISDKIHEGITSNCNFSQGANKSWACRNFQKKAFKAMSNIDFYDIYAPLCLPHRNNVLLMSRFDPCSEEYIHVYLNTPAVQQSLHVKSTKWESCNHFVNRHWRDGPFTVLPVVKNLMGSGISVWIYSGDTDARVPVTTSKYDVDKLETSIKTPWYPWMYDGEVGGYVVGYQNLTFVTIRGAGHFVPSTQPGRAIAFFTSFLKGKLP